MMLITPGMIKAGPNCPYRLMFMEAHNAWANLSFWKQVFWSYENFMNDYMSKQAK